MWDIVKNVVDGTFILTLHEIGAAMKLMAERNHVVAEGAGAATVAAALYRKFPERKVACVVSGGNIDMSVFCDVISEKSASSWSSRSVWLLIYRIPDRDYLIVNVATILNIYIVYIYI